MIGYTLVLIVAVGVSAAFKFEDACLQGYIAADECCKVMPAYERLKHPEDCQKYYMCMGRKAHLYQCFEGHVFDDGQCIESDKGCIEESSSSEEEDNNQRHYLSKACREGRKDVYKCCRGIPKWMTGFMKNPSDCSTFYQCRNRKVVLRRCPWHLQWSVKYRRCLLPQHAKCTIDFTTTNSPASTTPEEQTTTPEVETTTTPEVETTTTEEPCTSTPTTTTTEKQPSTPEEETTTPEEQTTTPEAETTPVEETTTTEKQPSTPEEETTTPEEHSSTTEKQTTTPEAETTPVEEPTTTEKQPSTPEEETTTPEEHSSTTEEQTTTPEAETTPVGETTTPEVETTTPEEQTTTPEEGTTTKTPETTTESLVNEDCLYGIRNAKDCCLGVPYWMELLLRNPADCGTFYQCVHEVPMLRHCPDGLHWNVATNMCSWATASGCEVWVA